MLNQCCLVHIGGLNPSTLNRLYKNEQLPSLAQLKGEGMTTSFTAPFIAGLPSNEVTLLTGQFPHHHGSLLNLNSLQPEERPRIINKTTVNPPVWATLEQTSLKCISVGFSHFTPALYAGVHENFFHPHHQQKARENSSNPANGLHDLCIRSDEIREDLIRFLAPNRTDRSSSQNARYKTAQCSLADLFSRHAVSTYLLQSMPDWNAAFINYPILDILSEAFLPFESPPIPGLSEVDYEEWNGVLDNAYRLLDQCIQTLRQLCGHNTSFYVVSSYGLAQEDNRPRRLSRSPWDHDRCLSPSGVIITNDSNFNKSKTPSSFLLTTIAPTIRNSFGLPVEDNKDSIQPSPHKKHDPFDYLHAQKKPLSIQILPAKKLSPAGLEAELQLYQRLISSLFGANDYLNAIDISNTLLSRFPEANHERLSLIQTLRKLSRLDEALEHARHWADGQEDTAQSSIFLSEIHYDCRNFTQALNLLKKAGTQQSMSPDMLSRIGLVYIQLEQRENAKEAFQLALRTDPMHGYSLLGMAYYWYQHQSFEQALQSVNKGLSLVSDYYLGWWLHAKICVAIDQPENAFASIKRALAFDPPFPAHLFHFAADIAEQLPDQQPLNLTYRQAAFIYEELEAQIRQRL